METVQVQFLVIFFLALGGRGSYKNDNCDFEITLRFEVAIVEE